MDAGLVAYAFGGQQRLVTAGNPKSAQQRSFARGLPITGLCFTPVETRLGYSHGPKRFTARQFAWQPLSQGLFAKHVRIGLSPQGLVCDCAKCISRIGKGVSIAARGGACSTRVLKHSASVSGPQRLSPSPGIQPEGSPLLRKRKRQFTHSFLLSNAGNRSAGIE